MAVSDEALLAGVAAGDTDATAAFVRRYQRRVYGLALSVVGDPGLAEDVAQDAFVRAWRHAGSYDPRRGKASTWLLTITRNAAIDVLRMRRDLPTEPALLVDQLVAGGDQADRVADSDRVRAALAELSRDHAVAVVLSAYFGLTAREISDRMAIPLGTAKSRIRTGLHRLRRMLEVTND
ncbi:MAG: sigma-70 family RNA polymerase sigma factor [Propionibacteriales bacterium]|nr:sigma-70 family RNA polymerase sigma factor [Propionibacteriales bacterium]